MYQHANENIALKMWS